MGATSNSQATGCSSAVDLVGGVVVYLSWMSGGCRVIDFLARENEAFVSRGGQEGAGEPEGLSVKWLDMFRGDHQAKWFREISPRQKLPFLRVAKPASDNPEGGPNPTLSETNSIIKFLCSHYKGLEQWYPSDVMARASVDEILDFLLANGTPPHHLRFHPTRAARVADRRAARVHYLATAPISGSRRDLCFPQT